MTQIRWSILVVGYNSPQEIRALLEDLAALPGSDGREILIAENGNRELPAMRALAGEFGAVLLELPNPGFGIACNALAARATGEFILLANPDLRLPRDIFPTLGRWLSDPVVGTVAPVLLDEDGSVQISWNLAMDLWWELLEAHGLQTWWRRRVMARVRKAKPEGPWTVGLATAACLALRAETYRQVGGFDEGFFLNYEDIELGDRIRESGLLNLVDPGIQAVHGNSKIQERNLTNFVFHRLQAKLHYLDLRYRGWRRWAAHLIWFEQTLIRIVLGALLLRGFQRTRIAGYVRALKFALSRPSTRTSAC